MFSFAELDRKHKAFSMGNADREWFMGLLESLKHMSTLTWVQISNEFKSIYDPHEYDWNKTNYRFNYNQETLNQNKTYQLRIEKSKGRIHGFLIGNRYYIYWLDSEHNMYDGDGYPSAKKCLYAAPPTPFESACLECNRLKVENDQLNEEIKEIYEYHKEDFCDTCSYSYVKKE